MNERLTEFYKQAFGYLPAPIGEPELEKFAALVAAAEREACASMVDHILCEGGGTYGDAIRRRSE